MFVEYLNIKPGMVPSVICKLQSLVKFLIQTSLNAFAISGCIGIALMLAMLVSSAVGTLIPLFFKKIKVDPAVASGPLITTVNDLVAVVTYYGLAWILLLNLLHMGQ